MLHANKYGIINHNFIRVGRRDVLCKEPSGESLTEIEKLLSGKQSDGTDARIVELVISGSSDTTREGLHYRESAYLMGAILKYYWTAPRPSKIKEVVIEAVKRNWWWEAKWEADLNPVVQIERAIQRDRENENRSNVDESAFVPAKELRIQRPELPRADSVTRFLARVNKDLERIRFRKPNSKSLLIHAGDWTRYWAELEKQEDRCLAPEAIQNYLEGVEERTLKERQAKVSRKDRPA